MPQDTENTTKNSVSDGKIRIAADIGGTKLIAKFPSSTDTYNVVKAEYVAMRLAAKVGLDVAPCVLSTSPVRTYCRSSDSTASDPRRNLEKFS